MPVDTTELFLALKLVASQEKLCVSVNSSIKGGVIAGTSALVGGLLGGRLGIAFGATLGGIIASGISEDFEPVTKILIELKPEEKEQLSKHIVKAFRDVGITDVFTIPSLIMKYKYGYQIALKVMKAFFEENMNMLVTSE